MTSGFGRPRRASDSPSFLDPPSTGAPPAAPAAAAAESSPRSSPRAARPRAAARAAAEQRKPPRAARTPRAPKPAAAAERGGGGGAAAAPRSAKRARAAAPAAAPAADAPPAAAAAPLDAGQLVEAYNPKYALWYRATVVKTDSTRVRVHYLGWKKTTDQWLEAYMVHVDDRAKPDKMKSSDNAGTPSARDGTTTPTLKAKKKNKA